MAARYDSAPGEAEVVQAQRLVTAMAEFLDFHEFPGPDFFNDILTAFEEYCVLAGYPAATSETMTALLSELMVGAAVPAICFIFFRHHGTPVLTLPRL